MHPQVKYSDIQTLVLLHPMAFKGDAAHSKVMTSLTGRQECCVRKNVKGKLQAYQKGGKR